MTGRGKHVFNITLTERQTIEFLNHVGNNEEIDIQINFPTKLLEKLNNGVKIKHGVSGGALPAAIIPIATAAFPIVKGIIDSIISGRKANKELEEQKRHNIEIEKQRVGKGYFLKKPTQGTGYYLKPSAR